MIVREKYQPVSEAIVDFFVPPPTEIIFYFQIFLCSMITLDSFNEKLFLQ